MKTATLSVRLEDDLMDLVNILREERTLGLLIRVFLKAIKHDRATTLAFMLGVSETSLNNSRILENTLRTAQLVNYTESGVGESFQDYLQTLGFSGVVDFGNGLTVNDVEELVNNFKSELVGEPKIVTSSEKDENTSLENLVEICIEKLLTRGVNLGSVQTIPPTSSGSALLSQAVSNIEENTSDLGQKPNSTDGYPSDTAGHNPFLSRVEPAIEEEEPVSPPVVEKVVPVDIVESDRDLEVIEQPVEDDFDPMQLLANLNM